MNVTDVVFNDIAINALLNVYDLDLNQYPSFDIKRYKVARADKSITTSKEARSKEITVKGYVCGANRSQIELNLALLKLVLLGIRGTLKVFQGGAEVVYLATCDKLTESWNRSVLEVELTFTAGDPYGKMQPATTLALPSITTSTHSFTLSAGSTVPVRPQLSLEFVSVTGGTNKTVSIVNSTTNIGISITNDFATGDVLYIDSEQMIITLNGAPVDFIGSFPVFNVTLLSIFVPEVNITYTDDFTARSVTGTFTYNVRI